MKVGFLYITVIIVLACVSLIGCQQEPAPKPFPPPPTPSPVLVPPSPSPVPAPDPVPAPTMETLTYNNMDHGFSIEYPKDWDVEEDLMGAIVVLLGSFIEETGGLINILIMSEELDKYLDWTLEDYVRVAELQIEKASENYSKVDQYSATIAGLPAIVASFTYDYQGDTFMATQAYFFREDVAWLIQYTAIPECYSDYVDCMELIMSTFKFTGNAQ